MPEETAISVNKALFDIYQLDRKQSDFTKSITLYGTPEINGVFNQIWNLDQTIRNASGQFNPDFNPNYKATATLYDGDVMIISGFIKLDSINYIDRDEIEYEVTLHGEQADLFSKLGETPLSALSFTDLNHTFNLANIKNSWDTSYIRNGSSQTFDRTGYVYALYHDGRRVQPNSRLITDFRPSLFFKEIVDKIFAYAGKTYSSDSIFNDNYFKKLIHYPNKGSFVLTESQMVAREFDARKTATQVLTAPAQLTFPNDSVPPGTDPGNNYNTGTSAYTCPVAGTYTFVVGSTITYNISALGLYAGIWIALKINGVKKSTAYVTTPNLSGSGFFEFVFSDLRLNSGDQVIVELLSVNEIGANFQPGLPILGYSLTFSASSYFYNEVEQTELGLGDTVDFTSFFNGTMTCKDFLNSIAKEFNLVWQPTPGKTNEITVKSLYSFYGATVFDLTNKLDKSQALEITPMGEMDAGQYIFTNTKGDDIEGNNYNSIYNEVFGTFRYKVDNDFVTQKKEVKSGFTKSMLYRLDGCDVLCSNLENNGGGSGASYIGWYDGLKSTNTGFQIMSTVFPIVLENSTTYPYSGHLDDPKNPTIDILFGMPKELVMAEGGRVTYTNNNQFNRYWKQYIEEITDKDSRVVSGWFNIRPLDYYNLTFDKIYFFEGQYFRLLSVKDYYSGDTGKLTKLSFLKTKTVPAFTPQSQPINRGFKIDPGGNKFPTNIDKGKFNGSSLGKSGNTGGVQTGSTGSNGLGTSVIINTDLSSSNNSERTLISGGNNVTVAPNVMDVQAFNCTDFEIVEPGVYIEDIRLTPAGATNGQVLKYNASTNRFEPQNDSTGSGGATIKQVQFDFGVIGSNELRGVVLDVDVTLTSKVSAWLSMDIPSGKEADELEMDSIVVYTGNPIAGQFSIYITTADGSYLHGNFRINYLIG